MPSFEIKLIEKKEIAFGTMAFFFEKPLTFKFKPGQFVRMTLENPTETDEKGNSRDFSIASGVFENHLMFAMRMRDSAFKNSLKSLPIGSEVKVQGPSGILTLHEDSLKPAIILTGGIGITPFRSIILSALHENSGHKLFLFYSNKTPNDAAFLEELLVLENPNYRCIATMTDLEKPQEHWNKETGFIDLKMISRHVDDLSSAIFYIAGPPGMVNAMEKMLLENEIKSDNIKLEDFLGY